MRRLPIGEACRYAGRMPQTRFRPIVEASYRLSVPRTTWLEGLAVAAEEALGDGCGTAAIVVDATNIRRARVVDYASTRSLAGMDSLIDRAFANLEPSYVAESKRSRGAYATAGEDMEQAGIQIWLQALGARDLIGVVAMDPSGIGAMLIVNLVQERSEEQRAQTASLGQLAAHLLAAYHLRERPEEDDDAVFRQDGEPVHIAQSVEAAGAIHNLSKAVRALESLRKGAGREAHALDRFTSRVDSTWSVVAQVGDDDDEWIVAKRNRPNVMALPELLSQREREVMSLLLLGRSQKMVAYELGLAHSTVRVLVSRALGKLKAHSVEDVRALFVLPP